MQRFLLVFVFAVSLFLKVAVVAGAEVESSGSDAEAVAVETSQPETILAANQTNISVDNEESARVRYDDPSAVLGTRAHSSSHYQKVALIPMIGGSGFNGRWYDHISNSYTFGLALDVPVSETFSCEIEGAYAKYNIAYSYFAHDFNQYTIAGNGKIYLSRGVLQPYAGLGVAGLYYQNMTRGPSYPVRYNQWVGAGQALVGADVKVSEQLAVGIRGTWVLPLFNRPATIDNGYYAFPYYEEASAMNSTFFRVMGSAKLSF